MATLQIPVPENAGRFFSETVTLEGVDYRLTFTYNDRDPAWYLDIATSDDTPILRGARLTTGINLLAKYKDTRLPPGRFFVVDSLGEDKTADDEDFGVRVVLFYQEAA